VSTRNYSDAWVCTDCYFAHHYGYLQHNRAYLVGPDFDPDKDVAECEPLALLAGLDLSDNVDSETENGIAEFSWTSCDGCGSRLGGSRYRLAVWKVTTN
jgi:hypothetical protein